MRANCYCASPQADNCRCRATAPNDGKDRVTTEYEGVSLVCDTQAEANSVFEVKVPICGFSSEVIPYCAPYKDGSGNFACYGREFALGTVDIRLQNAPDRSWVSNVGSFQFNGFPFTAKDVYVCDAGDFCCAPGENNPGCDNSQVPQGGNCTDTDSSVSPPALCGLGPVGGRPLVPTPKSDSDARIYFPHVKNTSALTYILQAMYRPISLAVGDFVKFITYSKVNLHQGIDDTTPVINQYDNNSSVIPGQPAPTPVYDFTHPPLGVEGTNGSCTISNVRTNPGDDLLGKKVYADLQYSQIFKYELLPGVAAHTCGWTGETKERASQCCSNSGTAGPDNDRDDNPDYYTCTSSFTGLPTKGKVLVYTKSPFLEYLYQNLVAGPAAIYKRFVSQDTSKDIKDVPGKGVIAVSANSTAGVNVDDQGPKTTAEIYFPHLGSVYDYFLKNLQKLLLPLGSSGGPQKILPDNSPQQACLYSEGQLIAAAETAAQKYQVPVSMLLAVATIEGSNKYVPGQPYTCEANTANSLDTVGPMQITKDTYEGVTTLDERVYTTDCTQAGTQLSRCNIFGAMELAARILLQKSLARGGDGKHIAETDLWDIYNATNGYYGGVTPDPITAAWNSRVAQPRPDGDMNYGDIVCALMSEANPSLGFCPPYPPQRWLPKGSSTGSFTGTGQSTPAPSINPNALYIDATPTQICSAVKDGIRRQRQSGSCVFCRNSQVDRVVPNGSTDPAFSCVGALDPCYAQPNGFYQIKWSDRASTYTYCCHNERWDATNASCTGPGPR